MDGSVLDELNYLKKLGFNKKNEDEIWNKFCVNCDAGDHEKGDIKAPQKFSSHPKRLCSETDASVASSRRTSVSSKSSDASLNLKRINFIYEQNKAKIQNARKNLTQTGKNVTYKLDLGMGDSCEVTPRNRDDNIITYYDSGEKFAGVGEMKEKEDSSSIPDKLKVPSVSNSERDFEKIPSSLCSYRNIVTDSIFEKKFRTFIEKSLHTITDIRSLLEGGANPPDGDEDESRRIVRVKEFSNRFSRNYLYPLARQLEELIQMSPRNPTFNQKLLSSYQIILNGLQAYHSHFPTSTGLCSSDRLKMLLAHSVQLCHIHSKVIRRPDDVDNDFINTFKANAELTLQKVDERFSAKLPDGKQKPDPPKASAKRAGNAKISSNKSRKGSLETRLSMYNVPASNFRKDQHWKKMMELWAKKRTNVKSRYKTATYRHRPPVEKKSPESLPSKCKLFAKKSSMILKRTPLTTPVDEDNITTMVQMEGGRSKGEVVGSGCKGEKSTEPAAAVADHEGIVVKLLQLVLDNNRGRTSCGGTAEDGAAKVADILERLKAGGDVEVLRKVLEAVQNGGEEKAGEGDEQLRLQIVGNQADAGEAPPKRRKEPTVTITGEKNAKLICITDENSIVEAEDNPKSEDKDCSTEKPKPVKPVSSTETQTVVTASKKNKSTQRARKNDSLKMKRLPKSSRYLQKLPKDYALSVIQYKLDFHKHCKQNPMYKKTTNVQPWILMARVSDQLLDNALLGVAREIELNDVVQQVYDSELH
ncbi:uncharacterized protein LOC108903404 [Anoplophora glabripennis]|uniref:uncharacterized protein LOC108903404 n=1 Tax=Anoplophora glabripennis TaxID=217634 RepID=UPI0008747188|nr:uncharacterized protein LOC108903404 [Anoplophora glabripennis]